MESTVRLCTWWSFSCAHLLFPLTLLLTSSYLVTCSPAITTISTPPTTAPDTGGSGCSISFVDEYLQITQNGNSSLQPSQMGLQSASYAPQQSSLSYLSSSLSSFATGLPIQQQQQQQPASTIGLECQFVTAEQLHEQFNRIKPTGMRIVSLVVRDSNLTALSNLPQGTHELKRLVISNSSIDLEILKEGSESLDQLTTLEITNERISNIPQNFFQEMQSLKELRLENDEIASLDGAAFHNLDDSLEVLVLRRNRFNRFPMAVKNLAQLSVLDLSDNDIVIDTQEYDLPEKLEPLLNLQQLVMNRINCTCEFSSSPFYEWIAKTHISGVRCFAPEKLKSQEVIVFERDEFCARSSQGRKVVPSKSVMITCLLCSLVILMKSFVYSQLR